GEPLRRPGRGTALAKAGGDDVLGRPAERAQRRTGEEPRPEPVAERYQQPVPTGDQDQDDGGEHDPGDGPGRLLVDGVGEREQIAHEVEPSPGRVASVARTEGWMSRNLL